MPRASGGGCPGHPPVRGYRRPVISCAGRFRRLQCNAARTDSLDAGLIYSGISCHLLPLHTMSRAVPIILTANRSTGLLLVVLTIVGLSVALFAAPGADKKAPPPSPAVEQPEKPAVDKSTPK